MADDDEFLEIPTRPDGTPKTFWYDREGAHMIYRHHDGVMEAIGFECRHAVEEIR